MSTNPIYLQSRSENSWRNGFASLLRKENRAWTGSVRGFTQALIWLGLFNVFLAFMLFVAPSIGGENSPSAPSPGLETPTAQGLTLFFTLLLEIGSIGVVILAHDKIVGEKQTGTAAWILSKPVSRAAFILSKLVSSGLRILVFLVLLPGLAAYGEISLAAGHPISVLPFLLGLGVAFDVLLFYLTLALALGTCFEQRGAILGLAFGVMFGTQIVASFIPHLAVISPLNLPLVTVMLAQGQILTTEAILPIVFTLLWSVLFIGLALWRFGREEF